MIIEIGFNHMSLDIKKAYRKDDVKNVAEAREVVTKFIHLALEIGFTPAYVVVDGENKMKRLADGDYEIVI